MNKLLKFVKLKLGEIKKFLESLRYMGVFSPLAGFWAKNIFIYTFLYPLIKLFLGSVPSIRICEKFIKPPTEFFPMPKLTKSRLILKNNDDWTAFVETWLRDSYHKEEIKPGMNIVDIGAHIGTYTVLAAEKTGSSGKVIAIEPEPKNYDLLLQNISINNFGNLFDLINFKKN